jgi:hypothetical protein
MWIFYNLDGRGAPDLASSNTSRLAFAALSNFSLSNQSGLNRCILVMKTNDPEERRLGNGLVIVIGMAQRMIWRLILFCVVVGHHS